MTEMILIGWAAIPATLAAVTGVVHGAARLSRK